MDLEHMTMEEKCEYLMSVVVESRKRYRKICIDYGQKSSSIENKMLNLQLETIANSRFKSKCDVPEVNLEESCKEADDFIAEMEGRENRIQELLKNLKNIEEVVLQLEHDNMGRKAHSKLTADNLLQVAKKKKMYL